MRFLYFISFFCFFVSFAIANLLEEEYVHRHTLQRPTVILGFVEDAERGASIQQHGNILRKKFEVQLQKMGGEIFLLTLSERMKWERLWSLPYTSRLHQTLKEMAKEHQINLIVGSYTKYEPNNLTLLFYNPIDQKTKVYYQESSEGEKQVKKKRIKQNNESKNTSDVLKETIFKRIEPFRQRPILSHISSQRQRNRLSMKAKRKVIHEQLQQHEALKEFQKTFESKSEKEIAEKVSQCIKDGDHAWMTSSKIDMYSKAYVLLQLLDHQKELSNKILDNLMEHEEFYLDRESH